MRLRQHEPSRQRSGGQRRWVSLGLQYVALYVFWLVLSGHYTPVHMTIGALSVAAVLFLNRDTSYHQPGAQRKHTARTALATCWRSLAYLTWLLYSIAVANIQVAYLVLHPRMPIYPLLLRFRVQWRGTLTQVALANSITLTPGTITVDLRDGEFTVHTLAPPLAQPTVAGVMHRKLEALFGEEPGGAMAVTWVRSVGALEP